MIVPGEPSQIVNIYCPPGAGGCGLSETVRLPAGYHEFTFICPDCMHRTRVAVHTPATESVDRSQQIVHAFGDESEFGDVIVYGLVVVHEHKLPVAEQFFTALKECYGVEPQAEFHCKEVFHAHPKQKSQWKHLSEAQVLDFAEELVLGLVHLPTLFIVAGVHRSEYPLVLPAVSNFPASEMGTKQLAGALCGAALFPLNQYYDHHQIKFWADPDRTRIPFFGRKMQAHKNYQLVNKDANQHIAPEPLDDANKPTLLEAADLFAYTATHALSERKVRSKERFESLYRMCKPTTSFVGIHDEENIQIPPPASRLHARHDELMGS